MKKSSFVLGLMVSTVFLFGNEFNGYEKNHSFLEPVDTVQSMIDARNSFPDIVYFSTNKKLAKQNFNILKSTTAINAHRADDRTMMCAYKSRSNNVIKAFFRKYKNGWKLKNVSNSKHQRLDRKLQSNYKPYESESCFNGFIDSFEYSYPNTQLRLISRETQVEGITLKKQGKIVDARFTLNYLPLHKHKKSGWFVSKIELKKSHKKAVKNKKVASNKRGFLLRDVVPALPNARLVASKNGKGVVLDTSPLPNLREMVCSNHQQERFIRFSFTLDRDKHIRKTFGNDTSNHKLIRFNVDSKKAKIIRNNCHFLQVDRNYRLGLNLKNFKEHIVDVKYGNLKNHKKSYMDLLY